MTDTNSWIEYTEDFLQRVGCYLENGVWYKDDSYLRIAAFDEEHDIGMLKLNFKYIDVRQGRLDVYDEDDDIIYSTNPESIRVLEIIPIGGNSNANNRG